MGYLITTGEEGGRLGAFVGGIPSRVTENLVPDCNCMDIKDKLNGFQLAQ